MNKRSILIFAYIGLIGVVAMLTPACHPHKPHPFPQTPIAERPPANIYAEVVALDQVICYNRFGSHNPYGMMYALKSDVIADDGGSELRAGHVHLRPGLRPRPLVLRLNPGDTLHVHFTNLIHPDAAKRYSDIDSLSSECPEWSNYNKLADQKNLPSIPSKTAAVGAKTDDNAPKTRTASMIVAGLTSIRDPKNPEQSTGLTPVDPDQSTDYYWQADQEGAHLLFSHGAPAGGEGDGGSLVHGLFGAVIVEPRGSRWYRSAVDAERLDQATLSKDEKQNRTIDYEAVHEGSPVLNLLREGGPEDYELIGSPLNAIIVGDGKAPELAQREFTVIFHDELKTRYAKPFAVLDTGNKLNPLSKQVAGIRDGFAVNYGASGVGTILLANRLGIGPAKSCPECAYEEFFLQSWANGDPALLARYDDDPSNVHHSYLNDRVLFRNLHAGPKETHVFHLHAHQWESSASGKGNYLDSQTIAPLQGFSYPIAHNGSGNRNKTPGDSIFHCHLYPHFAQGMWELWRVHDVFEDGTRRLPDGELGEGTNPWSGATAGGTPIPALVPLPRQAQPPAPDYLASLPGYPFFIPGIAGHRAPQPPWDLAEDAGLPRHVVTGGSRAFPGGDTALSQFGAGDLRLALTSLNLKILPDRGTPLEDASMRFHEQAKLAAKTPEGQPAEFRLNGRKRQPGAPFADPCDTGAPLIQYNVSAIDLDLVVNKHGWHDPQARINVLDEVAKKVEKRPTKDAEPFFFRVHSGDCVQFRHSNRTDHETRLDHFQVATPTDIIGQHIHLVKFDVTSSDGSGNGFNYEDGTLSKAAIEERIKASKQPGGSAVDASGAPINLKAKPGVYQASWQRWYVDPYQHYDDTGHKGPHSPDATLGTVFTHDHFAPSTIQQHGFYNAMLVEPSGSKWSTPDGTPMQVGKAVGSRANITEAQDKTYHPDYREFALAVADFALLYDCGGLNAALRHDCGKAPLPEIKTETETEAEAQIDRSKAEAVLEQYRKHEGLPVDPPELPEAISTHHHDPYLVNYKQDPIPLRMFERDSKGHFTQKRKAGEHDPINPADPAWVFSSYPPHGDPFLKPFLAYEGDRVQFRLIQGAQEVQHTFNLHGLSWRREPHNPQSPRIAAQEIGISEHFEMDLPKTNVAGGVESVDYLYSFGSVDSMWNGAWGLMRVFAGPDAIIPPNPDDCGKKFIWNREDIADVLERAPCGRIGPDIKFDNGRRKSRHRTGDDGRRKGPALDMLGDNGDGIVNNSTQQSGKCPSGAPEKHYCVKAIQVQNGIFYDSAHDIADPDGMAFVRVPYDPQAPGGEAEKCDFDQAAPTPVEPLVLRANAGDCLTVTLQNDLVPKNWEEPGDADLPRIVSVNTRDILPSWRVSLRPQIIASLTSSLGYGLEAGFNPISLSTNGYGQDNGKQTVSTAISGKPAESRVTYRWYAGLIQEDQAGKAAQSPYLPSPDGSCPTEEKQVCSEGLGPVNLASFGDVMEHAIHGLFGALVIEPVKAQYWDPKQVSFSADGSIVLPSGKQETETGNYTGSHAIVTLEDGNYFREHVLFYQDGLNLHYNKVPIPDCIICDDSYDLGERGVSYRSAPFWARLNLTPPASGKSGDWVDLNTQTFPANFFQASYQPIPTPTLEARPGERVKVHVLQPAGRARQRVFTVTGHEYAAMPPLAGFGSIGTVLMSPGKAITADLQNTDLGKDGVTEGQWLYRDGPAYMFSNGVWGQLTVTNHH